MKLPALRQLAGSLALGLTAAVLVNVHAAETIFPDTVVPTARQTATSPKWELGTVFRPTVAGQVTEVRVFSMAQEYGDHEVRLWRHADVSAGSITLRWEGEGPQFQVEKASTVNGTFQPVGAAQSERTFTDPGVLGTNAQNFYRVRQL